MELGILRNVLGTPMHTDPELMFVITPPSTHKVKDVTIFTGKITTRMFWKRIQTTWPQLQPNRDQSLPKKSKTGTPVPKRFDQCAMKGRWKRNLSRNRFLLHDPETGVTIVATDEALQVLSEG